MNCRINSGYYCIHYGPILPSTDKCYPIDYIDINNSYITKDDIVVIQSDAIIDYSNAFPYVFASNLSLNESNLTKNIKECLSIPVIYFKKSINSSSIVIGINTSFDIYCSRTLIVDLIRMKPVNINGMRLRNTNIKFHIKSYILKCNILIFS